ncbi:MAG: endonuclease/exonuclease/phosphatase family protein [Planctomycetota bacterium]
MSNESNTAPGDEKTWARWAWRRLDSIAIVCLLVSLVPLFSGWHWAAALATNLRAHLLAAGFIGLCLVGLGRKWRMVLCFGFVVLLNAWVVQPHTWIPFAGYRHASNETSELKILVWNIHNGTITPGALQSLVELHDPDVVGLLEVDPQTQSELQWLRDRHPTYRELAREDNFGLALYSRKHGIITGFVEETPGMKLRISNENSPSLDLFLIHPLPPIGQNAMVRNRTLAAVAQRVKASDASGQIVVGDWNCVPWAAAFRQFQFDTNLVDSRRYRGYQASWPSYLGWLGIPIDHALCSRDLRVNQRSMLFADSGTDHGAILLTIQPNERRLVPR